MAQKPRLIQALQGASLLDLVNETRFFLFEISTEGQWSCKEIKRGGASPTPTEQLYHVTVSRDHQSWQRTRLSTLYNNDGWAWELIRPDQVPAQLKTLLLLHV